MIQRSFSLFKRVLPLPSESWEGFGGGAFCHYHDHHGHEHSSSGGCDGDCDGDPIFDPSSVEVAPRDGDGLFNAASLMVAKSSLELVRNVNKNIQCTVVNQAIAPPQSMVRVSYRNFLGGGGSGSFKCA